MMERPEDGAPRAAWLLYVFERVEPIISPRDEDFASRAAGATPFVNALRANLQSPGALPEELVPVAENAIAELLALAQAVFDGIAYAYPKEDDELAKEVAAAFGPDSFLGGSGRNSRWWWTNEPGFDPRPVVHGAPHFAPDAGLNYEPVYIREYERRRLARFGLTQEGVEQKIRKNVDYRSIQKAAGIGIFQSSPDDSEPGKPSDEVGIATAAGLGLFQSPVSGVVPDNDEPEEW